VGGGFDNTVNPELTKPQEGFPTNQPVDGVTQASEKYPDLWDGFREDLSASEQTGVMKTITNPNDPSLGSNALNRLGQISTSVSTSF
jgi:hypothetical protein